MKSEWFTTPAKIMTQYSKTPVRVVVTLASSYLARNWVLLYLPPYLTEACVWATVNSMKNATLGKVLGLTVVAPAIVPTIMPYIGYVTLGCALLAVNKLITLLYRRIFGDEDQEGRSYIPPPTHLPATS